MTFPTTFANLAAGNQPASLLDTMFAIVGAQGTIPCTASGTNIITLTPVTNYYLPAAYANFQAASFVAANSSTGAVTIGIGALAAVNLYMPSGLQANSGDITGGNFYVVAYNGALNSGSGGFQVYNASTPSVIQPVPASFKNLSIKNGGTPTTQIAVSADQAMLQTSGGGSARVSSVSVTINLTTNGANGLDSGSVAEATWYSIWIIYNGSTIAGLASTSSSSPTLPSGYIYYARFGWVRTQPSSTNLQATLQYGRRAQYVVGTQTTALPVMASNATGNPFTPTWTAVSVSNYVPTTASVIHGVFYMNSGSTTVTAAAAAIVAPNNSYTGVASGSVPPPLAIMIPASVDYGGTSEATTASAQFSFMLESTNIYWAAGGSAVQPSLSCLGWDDNI